MPTTSNFGWTTPADTDLVKNGALAIRTLGNGIDTSMAELKGGTTGQILSKTSNTDMDFTWINNDQGDITEVQAGTGITVTSGTGPIPTVALTTPVSVANGGTGITSFGAGVATFLQTPTSANLAAALTDETGTGANVFATSPTLVTPNLGTPSAATLTNATGLPIVAGTTGTLTETRGGTNQTTYATGDLLFASGANTLSKRTIGSTGQVLTVSGGVPVWSSPAGGGKVLQVVSAVSTTSTTISTTTMTDTTISATITPSSTSSKILVLVSAKVWSNGQNSTAANWNLVRGTTNILTRNNDGAQMWYASTSVNTVEYITNPTIIYLDSPNTTSATTYKIQGARGSLGIDVIFQRGSDASTITLLEIGA